MKLAKIQEWKKQGYRVSFEVREGGMLKSDHMPDRDEELIGDVDAAWEIASEINHHAPSNIVNIYVIDKNFRPVSDYRIRMMRKHPEEKC